MKLRYLIVNMPMKRKTSPYCTSYNSSTHSNFAFSMDIINVPMSNKRFHTGERKYKAEERLQFDDDSIMQLVNNLQTHRMNFNPNIVLGSSNGDATIRLVNRLRSFGI